MSKLVLGLDIGVSSVGWGIIDEESGKIVDCAARIFPQADKEDNLMRRTLRGSKRLLRRKKHRLERVDKVLENINIIRPDYKKYCQTNPYELRVKGLKEKLSREELYIAIMHLAKRRGISYLEDLEDKDDADINSETIKNNLLLSKDKYICEIQLERLKKNGEVRGNENVFETRRYIEELNAILKCQAEYYDEIDEELIEQLSNIIKAKREYSEGPGSEKSRTDYGRFKLNGQTLDNLFEILIGKCSIFQDKLRAPKASYEAQLFNFLNDMNNITVNNEKLTYIEKKQIYDEILKSKSPNVIKIISKITNQEDILIEGYRIDEHGKPLFSKFEIYKNFFNQLEKKNINKDIIDISTYNEISYILTLETEKSRIRDALNKKVGYLGKEIIEAICNMDKSKFNGWHSLSYEAMNEIMDDLWHTSKEQHTLFLDHKLIENNYKIYQGMTNIPTDFIDDEIFNPIARRSIRQAINIVNAIRKQYGEMDKIIIEMAREISVDPKEIMKEQKRNIESKKEAALLASPFGYTLESIPGQLLLMLRLWREQDGRCIYSNKAISIDDLINRHDLFQVDHIIPKSISFDDGYNNKVLCYSSENQNKGNKISSRYFASGKASISYDEYKNNVNNLFERGLISNKKKELLLFDKDINKYEVRQGFINRNLVDTRYSTKLVLNILQDYMVANKIKTSIFTVKGAYTHHIREKWNLPKDRLYYKHHVVDALIIAASDYNRFYKNNSFYNVIKEIGNNSFDKEFLMMYDNDEYDKIVYSEPFPHFIRDLKDLEPRISHKIDTKVNRGISNQTIYSSRLIDGEEYQISKYSNIYDSDGERLKKAIIENPEKLLLYYGDKEHHTFNELKRIVDNYPNSKNPFSEYYKEHGKIRRYSKNGNGPYITSVKYIDRKLGNHLSIAHKYPNSKRNVFLLSINSYRMDVYQDINGNYKFISITGIMFKYTKNGYILDNNKVEEEKIKKHITPSDIFCFSLYKGDVFEITTNDQTFKYVFLSVNSDDRNVIECNYVERQRNSGERKRVTIGKDVTNIKKYYTDILGHVYNSKQKELTTNR